MDSASNLADAVSDLMESAVVHVKTAELKAKNDPSFRKLERGNGIAAIKNRSCPGHFRVTIDREDGMSNERFIELVSNVMESKRFIKFLADRQCEIIRSFVANNAVWFWFHMLS